MSGGLPLHWLRYCEVRRDRAGYKRRYPPRYLSGRATGLYWQRNWATMRPVGVRSTVQPFSITGCEILDGPVEDALNAAIAPAALVRSTCWHAPRVLKLAVCNIGAAEFPTMTVIKISVYTARHPSKLPNPGPGCWQFVLNG